MTEVSLSIVHELAATTSVRDDLDSRHIAALVEVLDQTPAIEVVADGDGFGVLDGYHRRAAAIWRGDETVRVRILEVPREQWLEHAILANGKHGRPLSLAERKRNAEALVIERPEMSNARVAAICGLSKDTVGVIRPELPLSDEDCSAGDSSNLNTRTGTDDKRYPASREIAGAARQKAAEFLRENPGASARQAAEAAGIAPATASDVKKRLAEGRPVDPAEEVLPPFVIEFADGSRGDAGTPEANAEALRLIEAAKAAHVHVWRCACGAQREEA